MTGRGAIPPSFSPGDTYICAALVNHHFFSACLSVELRSTGYVPDNKQLNGMQVQHHTAICTQQTSPWQPLLYSTTAHACTSLCLFGNTKNATTKVRLNTSLNHALPYPAAEVLDTIVSTPLPGTPSTNSTTQRANLFVHEDRSTMGTWDILFTAPPPLCLPCEPQLGPTETRHSSLRHGIVGDAR